MRYKIFFGLLCSSSVPYVLNVLCQKPENRNTQIRVKSATKSFCHRNTKFRAKNLPKLATIEVKLKLWAAIISHQIFAAVASVIMGWKSRRVWSSCYFLTRHRKLRTEFWQTVANLWQRRLRVLKISTLPRNFSKYGFSALNFAILDENFLTKKIIRQLSDSPKLRGRGKLRNCPSPHPNTTGCSMITLPNNR